MLMRHCLLRLVTCAGACMLGNAPFAAAQSATEIVQAVTPTDSQTLNACASTLPPGRQTAFDTHIFFGEQVSLTYSEGPDNGPIIVFIPGMAVPRQSYYPVARLLCTRFHVVMVDLRGQGESSWAKDGQYRVADYGDDIVRLLKVQFDGKPAIVSGHSLGGLVALWIAVNHPDLVAGFNAEDNPFLMSENPKWDSHWVKPMFVSLESRLTAYQASGHDPGVLTRLFAAQMMVMPRQDVPYPQRIRALGKLLSNNAQHGIVAADDAEQQRLNGVYRKWLNGEPVTNGEFFPRGAITRIAMGPSSVDPRVVRFAVSADLNAGFDHRRALAAVRVPTLYWNSDEDLVGVLSQVEHNDIVRLIGEHARIHHVIANGVGHLIHAEIPEQYAREISDFFLMGAAKCPPRDPATYRENHE